MSTTQRKSRADAHDLHLEPLKLRFAKLSFACSCLPKLELGNETSDEHEMAEAGESWTRLLNRWRQPA